MGAKARHYVFIMKLNIHYAKTFVLNFIKSQVEEEQTKYIGFHSCILYST